MTVEKVAMITMEELNDYAFEGVTVITSNQAAYPDGQPYLKLDCKKGGLHFVAPLSLKEIELNQRPDNMRAMVRHRTRQWYEYARMRAGRK